MQRLALALAVTLLAFPSAAAAGGNTPLRSFCFSATADYCASIWSFEYSVALIGEGTNEDGPWIATSHRLSAKIELFGSAFSEADPRNVFLHIGNAPWGLVDWHPAIDLAVTAPGFYDFHGNEGAVFSPGTFSEYVLAYTPTVHDVFGFRIQSEGMCRLSDSGPPSTASVASCQVASVPEPASMLLLATGGLGLAWVRKRRTG